jgi:ketosteroid isomerase-like protein
VYAWLIGRLIRWGYAQAVRGDTRLLLTLAADDIEFVFPGQNSFAGIYRGKAELDAWMQRFAALSPRFEVHDVVVSGAPWNIRAAVRFSDRIGEQYSNEGMEYLVIRWGRLTKLQVFEDTERTSAWERGESLSPSRPATA